MLSKAMIKLWYKFQIQILLQFYRRAEKVAKSQPVMVIVKSFDKSHNLFTRHIFCYYFVFPWLRFKLAEYKFSLT